MKSKCYGVYHARLVACGYGQVATIDFSENYLTVMSDVKLWVLLMIMINFELAVKKVNAKTAFPHWEVEEEIYVECPPGINDVSKDECINLKKCIFSLVQAARQYNKTAVESLKKVGFTRGYVNHCICMKQNVNGRV